MNTPSVLRAMRNILIAVVMTLSLTSQAWSSVIGVPGPNQKMGGVYFFSGWKCIQGILTGQIDGGTPFPLTGNVLRPDTTGVCNNSGNNGWIAQYNFNRLTQGIHSFAAYDGAALFASVTFQVVHFGVEFKTGVTGSGSASLSDGSSAQLTWTQGLQAFTVAQATPGTAPPPSVPSPAALLGTWRFLTQIGSTTFEDNYRLERVDTSTGTTVVVGTDLDAGDPIIAGLIQDIDPGSTLPFDYALFDPSITICELFVFDLPTPTTAQGSHFLFKATNGVCSSDLIGGTSPTTGTRISTVVSGTTALSTEPVQSEDSLENEAAEQAKQILAEAGLGGDGGPLDETSHFLSNDEMGRLILRFRNLVE